MLEKNFFSHYSVKKKKWNYIINNNFPNRVFLPRRLTKISFQKNIKTKWNNICILPGRKTGKSLSLKAEGYDSRMSFPRRARMGPCGNIGTHYSSIGEHEFDPRFSYSFLVCVFSSFLFFFFFFPPPLF